ncbi:hypothetical protein ACOTTU_24480 [Roseobacter sp. EG26]|uniref:hypothetical protein n=1 Tax=Roseobacter sp. EG26 TaxID=3412477 RepID=UPI003CE5095D
MNYQECLHSTFSDIESWTIAIVGLALAFVLRRFGRTSIAVVVASVGVAFAVFWAYLHYELNCVELFGL